MKLATLDSLIEGDGDPPPAATALWRDALTADRDRIVGGDADANEAAVAAIERSPPGCPGGRSAATAGSSSPPASTPPTARAARTSRAGRRARRRAVHELRKRGKDLWYQVRLLRDAWPAVLDATAEEIHDFTDKLGDHHDLAVLAEDLDGRAEV